MSASAATDGLRSDALRAALRSALGGRTAPLEDLLARLGRGETPRPNVRLAAAFAAELAAVANDPAAIVRLLERLTENDAAADQPAVFLPIAAVFGWIALVEADREPEQAWRAVAELAADGRAPVRLGAVEALTAFATLRGGRGADRLVRRAVDWLDHEDREVRFGAAAAVVEVFASPPALAALPKPEALLDYLSRAIDAVATAPRAAERSDGRRRLLLALPRTLATLVSKLNRGDLAVTWLEVECARARHPDVRAALSHMLARFASRAADPGQVVAQRLRLALEGSAKPPRDPTRRRPGAARGKASRPVR